MSTMLKHAAMSLLSKTLQTFLYKYLLDVDVEGVAMPSLMDADGSQSGWGVRLCNVRLREGVDLMTLPGKRKVKMKRRRRTRQTGSQQQTVHKDDDDDDKATMEVSTTTIREEATADNVSSGAASAPEFTAAEPLDTTSTIRTNNEHNEQKTIPAVSTTDDYYASDDGESDLSDGCGPRSRTHSAVAESHRSWMCFHRGTSAAKSTTTTSASPTSTKRGGLSPKEDDNATQATQSSQSLMMDGGEGVETDVNESPRKVSEAHTSEPTCFDDTGNHDESSEEEEFEEIEKDMVLRLGNGGKIGVLDVRLVGKELYVTVEDAFLVVEACQRPEEPDGDADKNDDTDQESKEKEPMAEKKKPAATSKKANKDMTQAERVLDKSAIARAMSAIPHLFLRDCRVRLVVREDDVGREAEAEISDKDSVVDLGIELLSVTSGEDFLAHVRSDEDASSSADAFNEEAYKSQASFASFDQSSNNEFIVKRIRTGRGPEGGIWLKVFPPGKKRDENRLRKVDSGENGSIQWARERWMASTEFCLFRCTGLDVRARIYVGKQEEDAVDEFFFYDEFAVDSMLVGVDYVAPGPSPALPPLRQGADAAALEAMQSMDGASIYNTDSNGIQSVQLNSIFHRVGRGLVPTTCQGDHLPCETRPSCWVSDGKSVVDLEHRLDSSIPLAGTVLNLSLNDPLEINVDRTSLEVLGQLVALFLDTKSSEAASDVPEEEPDHEADVAASSSHGGRLCMPAKRRDPAVKADLLIDSFPTYMQPENVEVLGLHLATIVVRIHAMREDRCYDRGLAFCFWETTTRCITMDIQTLSSEKNLQDVRIDVGEFSAVEYKGIMHCELATFGLPQPAISSSDSNSSSLKHSEPPPASPWPSTASLLLGIPAPLETIQYASRERHALQMRYIALTGSSSEEERSTVDIRIGVTSVNMPYKTKDAVSSVVGESKRLLFGDPVEPEAQSNAVSKETEGETDVASSPKSSLMKVKIRLDGGSVNVPPLVNLCLPPSTFFAEKSSNYGLFLETMLQRLEFAYGERDVVPKARRGGLSLFASLPESVRLRVLLFVNDLGPFEAALGLKRESNSFLRYRSVNRGIVKVAKQSSKSRRKKGKSKMTTSQREEVLAELLSMDDAALQELWSLRRSRTPKSKRVSKR